MNSGRKVGMFHEEKLSFSSNGETATEQGIPRELADFGVLDTADLDPRGEFNEQYLNVHGPRRS